MKSGVLSEKFYQALKKLEPRYPKKRALLLRAFHLAQKEKGWLSDEVLNEIAVFFDLHPSVTREVASFYTMFRLRPEGKHHLKICTNISCSLRGADQVLKACCKRLGIRPGETTADQKFTIEQEECLGACGRAPAMMVNDDYVEELTVEKVEKLLDKLEQDS